MNRFGWILAGLLIFAGWRLYHSHDSELSEAHTTIQRLERENGRLKARIAALESGSKTKPIQATVPPPPNPSPIPVAQPNSTQTAPPSATRVVDIPPPGSPVCTHATINSTTQLSYNLTWDTIRGGTYVGELPAGSIVEILYANLYIWRDYPDEHALYVKVAESPNAAIVGQIGYIELRRIGFKRCNLGPEFEK